MTDIEPSVQQLLAAYAAAVYAQDSSALMRLYDPKARVFDMWGVWSYEDAAAWQQAVQGWLSSLGSEKVKVRFEDVRITGTPECAAVSAIVIYASFAADGTPLRDLHNRLSWVLRTRGHALRIVHEHTSAPVGFEDKVALLKRP